MKTRILGGVAGAIGLLVGGCAGDVISTPEDSESSGGSEEPPPNPTGDSGSTSSTTAAPGDDGSESGSESSTGDQPDDCGGGCYYEYGLACIDGVCVDDCHEPWHCENGVCGDNGNCLDHTVISECEGGLPLTTHFASPTYAIGGSPPAVFRWAGQAAQALAFADYQDIEIYEGLDGSRTATIELPAAITKLAAGDFNGDGIDDLVASIPGELVLLAGLEGGTLAEPQLVPTQGTGPAPLLKADFDGDGRDDLVFIQDIELVPGQGSLGLRLLRGADVGFEPALDFEGDFLGTAIIRDPDALRVGVLHEDEDQPATVSTVALVDGALALDAELADPSIAEEGHVVAGDFDGNGQPEIARFSASPGIMTVWDQAGAPTHLRFAEDYVFSPPVTADVDGDGADDVVAAGEDEVVVLFRPLGEGACRASVDIGEDPWSVLFADVDGDGTRELVVNRRFDGFSIHSL